MGARTPTPGLSDPGVKLTTHLDLVLGLRDFGVKYHSHLRLRGGKSDSFSLRLSDTGIKRFKLIVRCFSPYSVQ